MTICTGSNDSYRHFTFDSFVHEVVIIKTFFLSVVVHIYVCKEINAKVQGTFLVVFIQ